MRKWKKYAAILATVALAGALPAGRVLGDVTNPDNPAGQTDDPGAPNGDTSDNPGTEPDTQSSETPSETPTENPTENPTEDGSSSESGSTQDTTENPTTEEKPEVGPWPGYNPGGDGDDPSKAGNPDGKADATDPNPVVIQTVVTSTGNEVYTTQAIQALQQQALKVKEQKAGLQKELNTLLASQNDYIGKLRALDENILQLQDKLDAMEEQKIVCQNTIAELQSELEVAQQAEAAEYEAMKLQIQSEYENGKATIYDFIFQTIDFSELLNRMEYINEVNSYEDRKLKDLTDMRRQVADQKLVMENMIEDIGVVEESYEDQKEILKMYSDAKAKQIEEYQRDIDTAKAGIKTLEQLEQQQTTAIAQLEANYRTSTTYVQYTYNGDKLLWPMPSSGQISSYFGMRDTPDVAGATADHRGIDIPCDEGSPCIAAASGVVMYTGYMGTGGNAVLIDCGSGITLIYYHLSAFNVIVGQQVNAGDVVAFSGNTGASTGPHLHFGIRINGEYQNPLDFLF